MEDKKYKIPTSRVILTLIISIGGMVALMSGFLWLMDKYSFLTVPLLLVIGVIFFTMNSWVRITVLPVTLWIIDNIKCPDCGGKFSRCFRPKAYGISDSAAVGFNANDHYLLDCPRCNKYHMVGNNGFSNELQFDTSENSRKIIAYYEKKLKKS